MEASSSVSFPMIFFFVSTVVASVSGSEVQAFLIIVLKRWACFGCFEHWVTLDRGMGTIFNKYLWPKPCYWYTAVFWPFFSLKYILQNLFSEISFYEWTKFLLAVLIEIFYKCKYIFMTSWIIWNDEPTVTLFDGLFLGQYKR